MSEDFDHSLHPQGKGISDQRGKTWNYFHIDAQVDTGFVAIIAAKVNSYHPRKDGVIGLLSGGKDFHIWVRDGDGSSLTWEMHALFPYVTANWQDSILNGVLSDSHPWVPIGFNRGEEGGNAIWYLHAK